VVFMSGFQAEDVMPNTSTKVGGGGVREEADVEAWDELQLESFCRPHGEGRRRS
jgi:hypothetical protein